MNGKLQEILNSGQAPFGKCGRPALDESTVYAKAPKAFRELETGVGLKRSARPTDARTISKYFGMSVDKIKEVWSRPPIAILLAFCLCFSASAGQINPGVTFLQNGTYNAVDFNNLVGNATVTPYIIFQQTPLSGANVFAPYADSIMLYSAGNQNLYRATVSQIVNSPNRILQVPAGTGYPSFTNLDYFDFYSAANTNLQNITFSNLVEDISSNISLININLTNTPLPNWTGSFQGLFNTNNQPYFIVFGANGVLAQQSFSNIETSIAPTFGTNLMLSYTYNQIFQPWVVYGTNTFSPYTNAWGTATNFPITGTNAFGNTNLNTLSTNDTFPLKSTFQNTNTTVTLGAIVQYLQGLNAIPAYTQARVQFSGLDAEYLMTNSVGFGSPEYEFVLATAGGTPFVTTAPTPFCLFPNGGTYPTTTPALVSTNQIYYGVQAPDVVTRFLMFTNYTDSLNYIAHIATNAVLINGAGSPTATNQVAIVTNYTSFAADAVPDGVGTGIYDIWFRTLSTSTNYYVSGLVQNEKSTANNPDVLSIAYNGGAALISTNKVRVEVRQGAQAGQSPHIDVLISPP